MAVHSFTEMLKDLDSVMIFIMQSIFKYPLPHINASSEMCMHTAVADQKSGTNIVG